MKPSRSSAKEKDREGPVKTVRARGAYRRNARIDMKFGRVVVHDIRGLGTKLPPSPFLCLPVPSMRKRPGGKMPRRPRPLSSAVLGEKDREGPVKRDRARVAYRRNRRRKMKLDTVLVLDMRCLDTELPPSPVLRLPVVSVGKRPRGNHRAEPREAEPSRAEPSSRDPRRKRPGKTAGEDIGPGKPLEGVDGLE